jgi:hypothetical protein
MRPIERLFPPLGRSLDWLCGRWDKTDAVDGVGRIGDISAGQDFDESHPIKSNMDGIAQTEVNAGGPSTRASSPTSAPP